MDSIIVFFSSKKNGSTGGEHEYRKRVAAVREKGKMRAVSSHQAKIARVPTKQSPDNFQTRVQPRQFWPR
jgi:hypothetical protein